MFKTELRAPEVDPRFECFKICRDAIESAWTHRPGVKVDTISYSVNQLGLITSSLFPVMFSMCLKYDTAFL